MKFKAGSLVTARNRDWVVLPSNNDKLVLLKPLGGSEEEITDKPVYGWWFPVMMFLFLLSLAGMIFGMTVYIFGSGQGENYVDYFCVSLADLDQCLRNRR